MVNYCCAAKHLCAMKTIQISPVVHHCMNCRLPMHGALCGALYSEMPTDIFINFNALSFEGRKRVNVQGAVMCGVCIESCRKEVTVPIAPEVPPTNRPPPPRAAAADPPRAAAHGDDDDVVIIDPPVQDERKRKAAEVLAAAAPRHPGKKIDSELRGHFQIDQVHGKVHIACLHCPFYNKLIERFNATKAREHLVNDCVDQYEFLKTIWLDPNFRDMYDALPRPKREKMKAIIDRCNDDGRWERITKLRELTGLFYKVHKALSREDFPLSAYILLTQGLRNEIKRLLNSNEFNLILGEGASAAVEDMINVRFNFDGKDPSGTQKVGLHDRHHLMCFIVDPFNYDGGASTTRTVVREDFMAFYTHTGDWFHTFEQPLPEPVSAEQLQINMEAITIDEVITFVEDTRNVMARLEFFNAFASNNLFFIKVARPLLSMRTVGSMDVERKVKFMKEKILTKHRNRLKDPKGVALYRVRENLNHIMKAKKQLGMKITESVI
mmetsp:Transcript_12652/g.20854  ORF Transcript_12652/g.20854 Transcript_12652/m.20854 type:complete len:495 (-) Transcript_12652:418-1902(-)